ncbi:unnamed protein product [Urochloa humidicola]
MAQLGCGGHGAGACSGPPRGGAGGRRRGAQQQLAGEEIRSAPTSPPPLPARGGERRGRGLPRRRASGAEASSVASGADLLHPQRPELAEGLMEVKAAAFLRAVVLSHPRRGSSPSSAEQIELARARRLLFLLLSVAVCSPARDSAAAAGGCPLLLCSLPLPCCPPSGWLGRARVRGHRADVAFTARLLRPLDLPGGQGNGTVQIVVPSPAAEEKTLSPRGKR